ncbi:MAG: matrixin family metalloprotease, partial [Planctomycetota bacterium]|nr:matrixin family metalloprotease [Planctomycetota bacterium]
MKNFLRLAIGGAVLTGSAMLMVPDSAVGYSVLGGSLGTGQRDHRLYNTFTASGANDNNTMIANMPGYDGAELAIWKAGAEWGARAFGDGSGDTTQSNLGDGGANLNFFWNGEASGIGGSNDNIHSPIAGSSGGVLAYCETPIADGWRIRYYQSWSWQDGPGSVSGGIDIQGVACHELGHALGLGHSTVGGATMYPSISGTGVVTRSIETDDKNGVKAVYGTISGSMAQITSVTGNLVPGGSVTINGSGFHASDNKLWLDSDVVNGGSTGGTPFLINSLPSTNGGTKITFTLPASGYVAGSIHVKNATHDQHYAVSEGHPFDVA